MIFIADNLLTTESLVNTLINIVNNEYLLYYLEQVIVKLNWLRIYCALIYPLRNIFGLKIQMTNCYCD